MSSEERVDHPAHYGGSDNPYEVIKVLRAWLTPEEYAGFLKGNIIKYTARARMKAGAEDHAKAKWYQDELVRFEFEARGTASVFREAGRRGGAARASNLTPEQRTAAARKAVRARWGKHKAAK